MCSATSCCESVWLNSVKQQVHVYFDQWEFRNHSAGTKRSFSVVHCKYLEEKRWRSDCVSVFITRWVISYNDTDEEFKHTYVGFSIVVRTLVDIMNSQPLPSQPKAKPNSIVNLKTKSEPPVLTKTTRLHFNLYFSTLQLCGFTSKWHFNSKEFNRNKQD